MAFPEDIVEFKLRTKIVYRDGAVEELPFELGELGASKVVIFTDEGVVKAGILDYVKKTLDESEIELVGVYDKIEQDAKVRIINDGARFAREAGADGLVALGGGSVMDTVKGINMLLASGDEDMNEYVSGVDLVGKPMLPHAAVPTTSGTGCEVTWGAVILVEEEDYKAGVLEWYSVADVAILDPQVTKSMPPRLTASTGMDALTHAIEGMTSSTASPLTDGMNLHAVRLVGEWLPEATHNGDNIEARGYVMFAATVAGVGFFNSMCGAVHACAHTLGGLHGIPHGIANTIMLPVIMEFNRDYAAEEYKDVAAYLGVDVKGMSPEEGADAAVEAVRKLIDDLGLPTDLKEWGIKEEDLPELAERSMQDSQMIFNPRPAEEEEILEVYRKVL